MAVTIPKSAQRINTDSISCDENNSIVNIIQFKGPYDDLLTAGRSFVSGDPVEADWVLKSWGIQRVSGGLGILSLNCTLMEKDSEGNAVSSVKKETWSLKSCRNDMSILAYCGPSEGSNPSRYQIEMWQKETDKDLVESFSFLDGKGEKQSLSGLSEEVAKKIASGVESVIRFYPVLYRKRLYSEVPTDHFSGMGFIDTPPEAGMKAKKPSGLAAVISRYQWLKIQDDCDEQSDGDWLRTESWMGISNADGKWDEDLYGTNRWPMPYGGNA